MMKTSSHAPASHAGRGALWFYYDAENQLTQVTSNNVAGFITQWQTFLAYDGRQRLQLRIERAPAAPAGGPAARGGGVVPLSAGWVTNSVTEYLYDGMRVIQERNQYNTPTVSYTRGTDLSGSMEGAGGIGGLLARSHGYAAGNWSKHNFYHADGNGNVTYLVNSSQTRSASYRYDPYGNALIASELLSYLGGIPNTYRFSSKMLDLKSGLYYYGYRWYASNVQRWLNRDPLGERGSLNLYAYVGNDSVNYFDRDGLDVTAPPTGPRRPPSTRPSAPPKPSSRNLPGSKRPITPTPHTCEQTCQDNFDREADKLQSDTAKCILVSMGFCAARRASPSCYIWVSIACGDKAAGEEVAMIARLMGCLDSCPKQRSCPPPFIHFTGY